MKRTFVVFARYPEAAATHALQETKVIATNFRQAANHALKEFQAREGVKRKQLTRVTLTIVRAAGSSTEADEHHV